MSFWQSRHPEALSPSAAMLNALEEVQGEFFNLQEGVTMQHLGDVLLEALAEHMDAHVLLPVEVVQDLFTDDRADGARQYLGDVAFPEPDDESWHP